MKRANKSTVKSGSSKQVKRTRLEGSKASMAYSEAKGVRRSVTQTLNQTQLMQQHAKNEERVKAILTGALFTLHLREVQTHAGVIGYDKSTIELLRGEDTYEEDQYIGNFPCNPTMTTQMIGLMKTCQWTLCS